MKSDLELVEECLEAAKKELITLQAYQAAHSIQSNVSGSSFSICAPDLTLHTRIVGLQDKIGGLEAQRVLLLSDNLEENLIIGSIIDIKSYLSNLPEDGKTYKLVRMKDNGE